MYYFLLLGGKHPRDQDLKYEPLIKTSTKLFCLMASVAGAGLLTEFFLSTTALEITGQ